MYIYIYVLEPLPATFYGQQNNSPLPATVWEATGCAGRFILDDSKGFPMISPTISHWFKSHSRAYGLHQRKHHARCPVQSASVMLQAVQLLQVLQQQLQELAMARLKAWKNLVYVGILWRGSYNLGTPGWMKLQQYTLLAFEMIHNSSQAEYINIDFRMERRVRSLRILWRHRKVATLHQHEN